MLLGRYMMHFGDSDCAAQRCDQQALLRVLLQPRQLVSVLRHLSCLSRAAYHAEQSGRQR